MMASYQFLEHPTCLFYSCLFVGKQQSLTQVKLELDDRGEECIVLIFSF